MTLAFLAAIWLGVNILRSAEGGDIRAGIRNHSTLQSSHFVSHDRFAMCTISRFQEMRRSFFITEPVWML